ncbi:hypothetical protein BH09SUM1_BH09SUM1_12940 [soil metagenome]
MVMEWAISERGHEPMPIIATPHRAAFGDALRANCTLDRAAVPTRTALRPIVAIGIVLAVGLATGNPAAGAIAAGGALSVGFGSFQSLGRDRVAPMLLATAGVTVATLIGCFTGHNAAAFVLFSALAAYTCGLFACLSQGIWWISLQCAVYAFIASSHPAGVEQVMERVACVFVGAALQALLLIGFFKVEDLCNRTSAPEPYRLVIAKGVQTLRRNISPRTATGREAIRLALAVAIAAAAGRVLPFQSGYWLPMTTLIVLRPDVELTMRYGLGRMAGTLIGAGLTTAITVALRPGPEELAVLVLLFAWLCYLLKKANYGLYAVCITSYVVFLSAMVGLPEYSVAYSRVVYTLMGGALALIAHFVLSGPQQPENEASLE